MVQEKCIQNTWHFQTGVFYDVDTICLHSLLIPARTLLHHEDKEGGADMPVAYMPHLEQVTLLQLDGILSYEQFDECVDKAIKGCEIVYEIQRQALMQKYFGNETELKEEQ